MILYLSLFQFPSWERRARCSTVHGAWRWCGAASALSSKTRLWRQRRWRARIPRLHTEQLYGGLWLKHMHTRPHIWSSRLVSITDGTLRTNITLRPPAGRRRMLETRRKSKQSHIPHLSSFCYHKQKHYFNINQRCCLDKPVHFPE